MRRHYIGISFVAFIVVAIACGYFVGREQGSQTASKDASLMQASVLETTASTSPDVSAAMSLPARNMPLKRVFPDLQSRASAGDIAAATRLYRDLRLCGYLDSVNWAFARADDELLREEINTADVQKMDDYRIQLDAIESRKPVMQKFHNLCDGVDSAMLDAQVPSLQKAAQLGEPYARTCYLSRGPNYDPGGLTRHPEWLGSYRANVKSMIDAGLAAGDWRVVDLLRNAYQPGSNDMLAGVLGADPRMYYRYLKLYRLGAEGNRVEQIDRQLAAAGARIKPEQRLDADVWAQNTLQQHFGADNSTESTIPGWDPCTFPYEPW